MSAIFDAQQAVQIYDPLAATYNKDTSYHKDDARPFVQKAAIHGVESVLDLGSGTGWVAAEARQHTAGKIVGIDISTKMVAEARQHAKDQGLQIAYLVGDFITMQGLTAIKPSGGFDVITCLWAFSNVAPDLRGAMLRTWTDFLAPQGRIVFEMHHPTHDLASYDVENESGKSVFRWKMLDQHSLATCAAACQAIGEGAGLQLLGELELLGVEGYEDKQPQLALVHKQAHPSRAQIEASKLTLLQRLVNFYWPQSGEQGKPVVKHKTVSVMGVWQKRT